MNRRQPGKPVAPRPQVALFSAAAALLSFCTVADTYIVCSELTNRDRTRAVIEIESSISGFEIVTPEHAWSAPDLPRGETDVSPNLMGREDVFVTPVTDPEGRLRILDFGVRDPEALELEGLRGSLVLHEGFFNNRAFASLYYTATGNPVSITALSCEQISDP